MSDLKQENQILKLSLLPEKKEKENKNSLKLIEELNSTNKKFEDLLKELKEEQIIQEKKQEKIYENAYPDLYAENEKLKKMLYDNNIKNDFLKEQNYDLQRELISNRLNINNKNNNCINNFDIELNRKIKNLEKENYTLINNLKEKD
jgi:hypothetical protein